MRSLTLRSLKILPCFVAIGCATAPNPQGDQQDEAGAASEGAAPELRDDGLLAHAGPVSPFDKNGANISSAATASLKVLGLVGKTASEWNCLSRPEVTVCRGANGAGRGSVLWVRYRGPLLAKMATDVPLFAKISLGGKSDSFPLTAEGAGAAFLFSDSLARCSQGAKVECEEAPSRVKALFPAAASPWHVTLAFGVTRQRKGEEKPTVDFDRGTPAYAFDLGANAFAATADSLSVSPPDTPKPGTPKPGAPAKDGAAP